jgi:hypothetical protein
MGSEPAFEFTLSRGEESSSGLLKVFVTSVYVDLGWIQQKVSPFDPAFAGSKRPLRVPDALGPTWDALTVVLRMTAR